jgi:hypothetical protein
MGGREAKCRGNTSLEVEGVFANPMFYSDVCGIILLRDTLPGKKRYVL